MFRALLVLILATSVARADDPDYAEYAVPARPHVKRALDAFAGGDYATSIVEWQAAYELDKNPQLLYGLAQAERFAKQCSAAIKHYRAYLDNKISDNAALAARGAISLCTEGEITIEHDPAGPRRSWYQDPVVVAVIGGSLGIVAGSAFLIAASSARSQAHEAMTLDGFQSSLDDATRDRRIGLALVITGAAVGAAAIVYRYKFSASPAPHGAVLAIAGSF